MSRARRQQYMLRTEASEQEAVITICKFMENRYPELKLLHHCPNGGKRDHVSAAVLKRQGVKEAYLICIFQCRKGSMHLCTSK